jgi:hypothetical protein
MFSSYVNVCMLTLTRLYGNGLVYNNSPGVVTAKNFSLICEILYEIGDWKNSTL